MSIAITSFKLQVLIGQSSGLFNPVMVSITTCDDREGSTDPAWEEKFTIPLDLLTASSPYFVGLFEKGFA